MMQKRRAFLQQCFSVITAGVAGSIVFQSCGNDGSPDIKPGEGNPAPPATGLEVVDSSKLTKADFEKREQLGYVDQTPIEDNRCENCALYIKPNEQRDFGGCQLFRGPVNANGYCAYWAAPQEG